MALLEFLSYKGKINHLNENFKRYTVKSGFNSSQIGFFLIGMIDRATQKDCKLISGESLSRQHGLVVSLYLGVEGGN